MQRTDTYLAFACLGAACFAWCGVWYFSTLVAGKVSARETDIQTAQQSLTQQSSSVRTHAIAQETAADRSRLDALVSADIVSIANTLRSVGKATGVEVRLGSALPESTPVSGQGGTSIQAVGFALEADGGYSALMRTLQIIESLPLASGVERLDLQRAQAGSAWHLNAFIRVLTTAPTTP